MRSTANRVGGGGLVALALLIVSAPVAAQEFRGRITGAVTDTSGAVLPGVTVTADSPALIQAQVAVTGQDGVYRLIALPVGVYSLTFELTGFQAFRREGIRVLINQTLTVDAELRMATLQETVTVTGESPVIDTSTTRVGTNVTTELLEAIPNARNIWAVMSEVPGMQMTGIDVGGSTAGTQLGYITYGMSQQRTTRIEGINHTEGASANAGNFDYGSLEEFQIGAAGNLADQDVPGASLNVAVKSGGDQLSGRWYSNWQGKNLISNNVPDALKTAGGRTSGGYFTPSPLERGNPIDRMYEMNPNLGGPIRRNRAWFFASYQRVEQYKFIIGFDQLARTTLEQFTIKPTLQLTRNNQIIGFWNRRVKSQPLRNLGPTTPVSAAIFQEGFNRAMKIEWTSVLSNRLFLDVLVGQWFLHFPMRPTTESGAFPAAQFQPGRIDVDTGQYFEGGGAASYQIQDRSKPQLSVSLAYFRDQWAGTHDFKFGFETRRDRRQLFNDQPFDIFYRDKGGMPSEVDLYNTPVESINDTVVRSAYAQDTWKLADRLTLNLGLRMDHYRDGWPDQSFTPNGIPAVAGDPRVADFFAPKAVAGKAVSTTTTWAPRAGFAYSLWDGRSAVKGFYGRFYFNSADIIADNENPVGRAQLRFQFNDLNANRLLDGPQELGRLLQTLGGAGFVRVDPALTRTYGDELSAHFEQQVAADLSARISYIYKNIRNEWEEVDVARVGAYTLPFTAVDPGPDGVLGTSDDQRIQLLDRPAATGSDRVFTIPKDPAYDSDYSTIEVALNRRFRDRWMVLTSFGYTWMKQFHGVTSSTSVLSTAGIGKAYDWRPNQRLFGRETTTYWNYKLNGRYAVRKDLGVSGSYRLQSGRQWGRTISVRLPGAGVETIRVEAANARRAPSIDLLDLRLDKTFDLGGRRGRITGLLDVFNVFNNGVVTNFRITTGSRFQEIISLLDPRIIRLGIQYDF